MTDRTFQKFAGGAAILIAPATVAYILLFLFVIPKEQNQYSGSFTWANALTSLAVNPTGRQLTNVLVALAGIAAATAIVGIYRRLGEKSASWALWFLCFGLATSILTAVYGVHTFMLDRTLSDFYVNANAATKASIIIMASTPSPLDPFGFSKYFLSGLWLLVAGWLMLRSAYFPRYLAYLAMLAAIGALAFYLFRGTLGLIVGIPGAFVFTPLFWLGIGYTLWTKE